MGSQPYTSPQVRRFGDFRTLTQVGFSGSTDGCTITGPTVGTVSGNDLQPVCARS